MKNKKMLKWVLSGILAVTMLLDAGCSMGPQWAYRYDGMEISAGMYNYFQIRAMASLQEKDAADHEDEESYTAPSQKELLMLTTDGMNNADWVKSEAAVTAAVYFYINKVFDDKGLVIDDTDRGSIGSYVDYIMSFDKEFYDNNGVGRNSVYDYELNEIKKDRLFLEMYGEGGERAVSDDELKAVFQKKYAKVEVMTVAKGADDAAAAEAKTMSEDYLERYESGERIEDLIHEYNSATAAEGTAVDKPEEGAAINYLDISMASSDASKAMVSAELEKAQMVEDTGYFYIFKRMDVMENPVDFEDYREAILRAEKEDEFKSYLREQAAVEVNSEANQSVINSYAPGKLKLE